MNRVGMTWLVHEEHLEPYTAIHLNPWPDLLEAIQAVGIHNYSIFAMGNRMFAYLEVDGDVGEALGKLGETEVYKRWAVAVNPWVMSEAVPGGVQFMEIPSIFFCA